MLSDLQTLARPTPPPSAPLQRISDALKDLSRFVLTTREHGAALEPIARQLERLCAGLPGPAELPATRFHPEDRVNPDARLVNARGTHPLVGSVNPISPPIELRGVDDQVVGDVEFDLRYEGNVGWVHGGFIAAGFDIRAAADRAAS